MGQEFEHHLENNLQGLSDDNVQQMLEVVERLGKANGGVLDDAAILAVSEATGASPEYVRLAVKLRDQGQKQGLVQRVRSDFVTLDPDNRRYIVSIATAAMTAILYTLGEKTGDKYQLLAMLGVFVVTGALYNVSVSKDSKVAALTGAIYGTVFFAAFNLFSALLRMPGGISGVLLIPFAIGGALIGMLLNKVVDRYRNRLGLSDPIKERQDLLRQLHDIRSKLESGEQRISFLSVDIVGSTRMKQIADRLAVEFTFTEYHNFIDMAARRFNGRVHSTAGDGVTVAFDYPQDAFMAAKNIQTGIIELNTHRNKTGIPLVLRCGIHCGTVVAPDAGDIKSVNFASVIDIAAHLQKVCPPGGIVVSAEAAGSLSGGPAAVGPERVKMDDMEGVVWSPRAVLTGQRPPDMPPAPKAALAPEQQ